MIDTYAGIALALWLMIALILNRLQESADNVEYEKAKTRLALRNLAKAQDLARYGPNPGPY